MTEWKQRLDAALERYSVPGAVLLLARGDEVIVEASGITNVNTRIPVTTETVFQIGSISKVWTATVAMQLVDEGLLDLDVAVVDVIPGFRIADDEASRRMTMRHLLTHTSGLHCDLVFDTGRGDDALEKYIPLIADSELLHPVGGFWSYCNAGFIVAGRVLEVLTGKIWDELVLERIIEPLGLTRTATLPEDVLLHSAALGHVHDVGEPFRAAERWHFPRSIGPAGIISATAEDLLAFARAHARGGEAGDGRRILSTEAAKVMATPQFPISAPIMPGLDSWGIGWALSAWGGKRVISHTGGTIGQFAFLDIVPGEDIVSILLTNGGGASGASEQLRRAVGDEWDLDIPRSPEPIDEEPGDVPFGRYTRYGSSLQIVPGDDGSPELVTIAGDEDTGDGEKVVRRPIRAGHEGLLVADTGSGGWTPLLSVEPAPGVQGVMLGTRLLIKDEP